MKRIGQATRTFIAMMIVTAFAVTLTGCGPLDARVNKTLEGKTAVALGDNGKGFDYRNVRYSILNDVVPDSDQGSWIAYIRVLAAFDSTGKLIKTQKITANPRDLENLAKERDVARVISYMNIYRDAKEQSPTALIIEADGSSHKAVPTKEIRPGQTILDTTAKTAGAEPWSINAGNITQLHGDAHNYTITDRTIDRTQLGGEIADIDKSYTIDRTTNRILSDQDLKKMDWTGTGSSNQNRQILDIGDIQTIAGQDRSRQVAIQINGEYRVATSED